MNSISIPNNPYVTIQRDNVFISCSKQYHTLPFDCIRKIYLTKKKSGYWSGIIGQLLFVPETKYIVHIITSDVDEIKFTINPMQRFYFIRLISLVRAKISSPVLTA